MLGQYLRLWVTRASVGSILWLLQKNPDKMSKLERVRTEAVVLCDHKSMKERNLKNAWKNWNHVSL